MNFSQVLNHFQFTESLPWWRFGFTRAGYPAKMLSKTLEDARQGECVTIASVHDPAVAAQLLRLGVMAGVRVRVLSKTPGDGPIVIQLGDNIQSELAIGRAYAQEIEIQEDVSV